MSTERGFDRHLRDVLRDVLDLESGPHPLWVESPAAERVAEIDRRRHSGRRPLRILALAAVLLLGGTVVVGALRREPPQPSGPPTNGWIAFRANGEAGAALEVTDVGRGNGKGDLYIVGEDGPARRIIGSEDDARDQRCPAFSPDGARLAYVELDTSTLGGATPPPQPQGAPEVTAAPTQDGAPTWRIVVVAVGPDGAPTSELTRVELHASSVSCAEWSPDGERLASMVSTPSDQRQTWIASIDGTTRRIGPAVDLLADALDWSPDGSTIGVLDVDSLWLIPVSGEPPRSLPVRNAQRISWSPDGGRLAVRVGATLRLLDLDGTTIAEHRLDTPGVDDPGFAWSPDGRWIAWAEPRGIVRVADDGSRTDRRSIDIAALLADELAEPLFPPTPSVLGWSPDGTRLLLAAGGLDTPGAIVAVPWDASEPAAVLVGPTYALRGIGADWQEART